MKVWKVILAALVIFAAGVVTGGLTVRVKLQEVWPSRSLSGASGPLRQRMDLLDRMQRQLYLTPTQRERLEQVLRDSHGRTKKLWDSIAPEAQEEQRRVHDLIRAELTPEQQQKFESMLKARSSSRTPGERRPSDERREPRSRRAPAKEGAKPEAR